MLDYIGRRRLALAKIHPPREVIGVPLGESRIRSKHGITVVAVKRRHGTFTDASYDTTLSYDDIILVVGRENDIEHLLDLS